MNICDYLNWRGDLSFEMMPFCEADALVMAQLSYYEYENLFGNASFSGSKTLFEIGNEHIKNVGVFKKVNPKLAIIPCVAATHLLSCAYSAPRFGNVRLTRFHSVYDAQKDVQFAAATFAADQFVTVAFRGTDDSVAGWKEDFNLSYAETIPAQQLALGYLREEVARWRDRPIYVCGHSKGGNLAMYACLHLDAEMLPRITKIYNFDGPGFNRPMESFANYAALKEKIVTVLPESSIVGLLLHHENDYQIIASEMVGILQHNVLMWQVMRNSFVYAEQFSQSSLIIKKTLDTWLEGTSDEARAEMIDVLFGVIEDAGIETLGDLNGEGIQKIIKAVFNAAKLTTAQKKMLAQMLYELVRAGALSASSSLMDSEFASEAIESAKTVKDNITGFFSDGAARMKEAVSSGPKGLLGGIKLLGKNKK